MSVFSLNKSSQESKILRVLQHRFFITARRNKILAKWAGGRLGYTGSELSKYIRKIVLSHIVLPNDRKLVDKIESDFIKNKIAVTREEIEHKMRTAESRAEKRSTENDDN